MIRQMGNVFVLDTKTTTYCFRVMETGHLEHLYYGEKIEIDSEKEADALVEKRVFLPGNANAYSPDFAHITLEDLRLEISSYGKGDLREPFVEVIYDDGSSTSDFVFDSAVIKDEKTPMKTLPSSYEEDGVVNELVVTLREKNRGLTLELHYAVFETRDVVTRWSVLKNISDKRIRLTRLMSNQIDFEEDGFVFTTFNGAWAREMYRKDTKLSSGKVVNSSVTGSTSNRANSFVMLSKEDTTEDAGTCYGFNLVYSGNHYEVAETTTYQKTRFVSGINPQFFEFVLEPEQSFESPEVVMTVSNDGFNGMSQHMHDFVRNCIVRGEWKKKERPILLNSWEAAYFDINESKLLKLAKAAKDVGIELFVMDDGWFGTRDDDTQSLGDWDVNKKKLPNGIEGICKKINDLGLDFGIWVEPEMINVKSNLYKEHPEWVIEIPNMPHSEGRNQRILDLSNPEVVEYIVEEMTKVFSAGNITYVKWDMNRIFSDYFSQYLPVERQQELGHRYILGLYQAMDRLTKKFPHILFEGCAAGGNRFDLGILCYFPQIWASDDTDAFYRVHGQTGYSYGYPMSVVTAHVSASPNHQTLRNMPLTTRFNVAAFGVFGYEVNLCELPKEEIEEIRAEIEIYKEWRSVLQFGNFYRGRNENIHEWTCVSEDKKRAVGFLMQERSHANTTFHQYFAKGLDAKKKYHFTNRNLRYNIKNFGGLVNMVSPIHVKQDGMLHNMIAKFVTMPGENEDYIVSGSTLMKAGLKLKQAFASTGYNEETRLFLDNGSRLYFMDEIEKEAE